jgi:hypothetical protein
MSNANAWKQLLAAAWNGLKQDKELMTIPILGGLLTVISVASVTGIAFVMGAFDSIFSGASSNNAHVAISPLVYLLAAFTTYLITAIAIYFQAALMCGAMQRLEGGDPTVGSALRAPLKKLGPILLWALVATTVGLLLRLISDRGGAVARMSSFVTGIAWSVATFFVLPVVVFEGRNSFAAAKKSAELVSAQWGTAARTGLRFGFKILFALVAAIGTIILGVSMMFGNLNPGTSIKVLPGLVVFLLGLLGLVVISIVAHALTSYIRVVLYRYAIGKPVPGISNELLSVALTSKR